MNPRDVVLRRLQRQVRRFPDLDHQALDTAGLSPQDAALARAIDHAVNRHWLTLVGVLEAKLSQPWGVLQPPVQAALLGGAAQLFLLDRVPDHAAINESVAWVKRQNRSRASGLVNAVLRRVAEVRGVLIKADSLEPIIGVQGSALPRSGGDCWMLAEPVFDADPARMIAQQTSHPESLISHWMSSFSRDEALRLALHNLIMPPMLVTGLDEASRQTCADMLSPHSDPGWQVFTGDHADLDSLLSRSPSARVQDPTAGAAVMLTQSIDPLPRTIIDLCAGRGTKTRQLADAHPEATIIATDRDTDRLGVLRETFADAERVNVVDFRSIDEHRERADLLVLDVPCSNTGVLARRVEAKYRFSRGTLTKLTNLQRQIMADAIPLLASGGRILYSTCSIERAENERQIEWLQKWHHMELIEQSSCMPACLPGDSAKRYRDGGYAALLRSSR